MPVVLGRMIGNQLQRMVGSLLFCKTTANDHPHFLSNLCYTVFVELFRVSAIVSGLVQGIWGLAGEAAGILKVLVSSREEPLTTDTIDVAGQGHILVGGTSIDRAALLRAAEVGASGVVVGSFHSSVL